MPKKQTNQMTMNTATAGFTARFTELQSSFDGKGFFGKLLVTLLMLVALVSIVLELSFLFLKSLFSAVIAIMGDKTTTETSKLVRKNNLKSFQKVANGKIARAGIDNINRTFVSSVGGKLDLVLFDGLNSLYKRTQLKEYFRLLNIKDKSALKLIDASSCQKLLTQYDKSHGSVMKLKVKVDAEKTLKKANRKAAKKTRNKVNNVTSWSATGPSVVIPVP